VSVRRIGPDARRSHVVNTGGLVHLSGQVAEGATVGEQTQGCLDKIDRRLAEAGTSKANAITATIWLTDISEFDAMNAV
jgi:enamine deaminase RidA (YjgF/YER057c/UK114 family)